MTGGIKLLGLSVAGKTGWDKPIPYKIFRDYKANKASVLAAQIKSFLCRP